MLLLIVSVAIVLLVILIAVSLYGRRNASAQESYQEPAQVLLGTYARTRFDTDVAYPHIGKVYTDSAWTPQSCAEVCRQAPHCYQWMNMGSGEGIDSHYANTCWMKTLKGPPALWGVSQNITSGSKRISPLRSGYTFREMQNWHAGGTGAVKYRPSTGTATAKYCRDACAGDPNCTAVTFSPGGGLTAPHCIARYPSDYPVMTRQSSHVAFVKVPQSIGGW